MGKSFDNEQGMEIEMEFHHRMSFDQASQANSSGRWEHGLPLSSDNLGLSKCFKVTVIAVSVIIMLVVILCFTFVLPRSEKKERSTLEIASTSGNIGLVCQATRYPDVCFTSLESDSHSSEANSSDILKIAIHVASTGVTDSLREASQILENFRSNVNISAAARDCKEVLSYSLNWLQECMNADVTTNVNDIQAWLSAALTYQNDCNSSLTYVNTTDSINQAMIQVHSVIPLISNALSMADAYASYGSDPVNWKPPASGREVSSLSSWNWQIHHERHLSDALEPSAVVSQDSSGAFNSIQDAVDKAPDNSRSIYVIHIREGTYHEIIRIPQCKTRLMFLGDGIGKTIITGDLSVQQPGINTMDSATIVVSGAEFIAQDLTIQNTAGPEAYQAVALRVDSDRSAFHRVAVLGYQDSLYAHTLRQFYRDCLIEGTIDFIFGNSAAIFQNCSIRVRVGRQGVADSTVTAHGRTDPAQTTGLVFYNCSIDGTAEYNAALAASRSHYRTWLGRPWKQFSRTIYIETFMGALVDPEGWKPWNGDYALATLYYGEFHSYGPGGNFSFRVGWSLQLTGDEISGFSVQRFIQGTQWLPETNIPFDSHDLD